VTDLLRVERSGPNDSVARVTLTRPEVHNAFNASLIAELRRTFAALAREGPTSLRVVVLGGDGPSFSAGADIDWMRRSADLTPEQNVADAAVMPAQSFIWKFRDEFDRHIKDQKCPFGNTF